MKRIHSFSLCIFAFSQTPPILRTRLGERQKLPKLQKMTANFDTELGNELFSTNNIAYDAKYKATRNKKIKIKATDSLIMSQRIFCEKCQKKQLHKARHLWRLFHDFRRN